MTSPAHAFAIILVCGIVTFLLRTLPLYIWNGKKKIPDYVLWLGQTLPYAIIMMLVVYSLKGISFEPGAVAGFGSSSTSVSEWVYAGKSDFINSLHDFVYRNSGWFPPIVGAAITSGSYFWKKNTLLSILLGTVSYMALLQLL